MLKRIHSKTIRSSFLSSLLLISLIISLNNLYIENNFPVAYADSTDSGFNFFTDWVDISIGVTGSYEDIDLSGSIPVGSTGVIIVAYNKDATMQGIYIREAGSTDDYYEAQTNWDDTQKWFYVGVNSTRYVQMKISDTDIDCYLVGYMDDSVVMFTNGVDYSIGFASAWTEVDASPSVPVGATGVIVLQQETGQSFDSGSRHPDSTDDFRVYGRSYQYQLCGVNPDRTFETWVDSLTVNTWVFGYTTETVQFNINWDDVSLGIATTWTDIDVQSETSVSATGVIIYGVATTSWNGGSIQDIGSTNNPTIPIHYHSIGQQWLSSDMNSTQAFEGYITSTDVDFYVVGYAQPIFTNLVYPDHVESAFHVTNATDTLDDDNVYAELEFDGVIVWDFGGASFGNVTAIRWELAHQVTGGLWRLEGNDDLGASPDWEIIAQMTASEISAPPISKNDSTRYDGIVFTPYRYLKISAVSSVLNEYWIDYICYVISPPDINYTYGDYYYPIEVEQWEWNLNSLNYASRPFNMLGLNRTIDVTNDSSLCFLVNADNDAENMAIVKFDDFYNISSIEVLVKISPSNQHGYLYVSSHNDSDWELVWNDTGNLPYDWYGDTNFNATYIRFAKFNGTGIGTNPFKIGGFRIEGELYGGGSPPVEDGEDGGFALPSFGDLPTFFGAVLGIGVYGAGIFLSGIVLMAFLLPIVWYGKSSLAVMIVGLVMVGFLVTISWLPTFIILIIILLIAGMYASKIGDWLSPQGKK